MVQSPVGFRCPDCGKARRIPTYDVSKLILARGLGAGIFISVALGGIFAFLSPLLFQVPYLPLAAIVGIGFAIGEGISFAVNRKRGRSLKFVAAGCMLLSYLVMIAAFSFLGIAGAIGGLFADLFGLLALAGAFYVSIRRF